MSMPLSPTRLFVCTACGAVLPVGEEHVGKKCRCGRCGKVSLVGDDTPQKQSQQAAASERPIGFNCRVCDTRLAARVKHVGRKAKCPDCGALTKVPPPPEPRPSQKPKAMHGQQYGVWSADDAPSPAEIAARQPKYFPVYCRNCDTLMHAQLKQVGKKLACPDCGAKTPIVAPPKPKPKKSALVADGQEYQLDATHAPPTRPEKQFAPKVTPHTNNESQAERKAEEAERAEQQHRPKLPQFPIVQGVSKMMRRGPVIHWMLWLTAVGCTLDGFMLLVISLHPVAAIPFFVGTGMCAILGLSGLFALCMAVMTDSSEGNDRLYNPPSTFFLDWIGDIFYLLISAPLALAPWWLLCQALQKELPIEAQSLVMLAGWLLTFPMLFLSCLENGSPWEPFSLRVLGSVGKRPGHWLALLVVSLVIVGSTAAAGTGLLWLATQRSIAWTLLETPLLVIGSVLYFRVLGRFAWWLAKSLATNEVAEQE